MTDELRAELQGRIRERAHLRKALVAVLALDLGLLVAWGAAADWARFLIK